MISTKWDARFLRLAREISTWSKDPSTKVGAVIIRPDRVIKSVGYNGFARGVKDWNIRYQDRTLKYQLVLHAEENAILNAADSVQGCFLYVYPLLPCNLCTARMIQAGITRVTAIENDRMTDDHHSHVEAQFNEANVAFNIYTKEILDHED